MKDEDQNRDTEGGLIVKHTLVQTEIPGDRWGGRRRGRGATLTSMPRFSK